MKSTATVVLLANDITGLEVAKYFAKRGDTILRLYIHSPKYQKLTDEIIKASNVDRKSIFYDTELKNPQHVRDLKNVAPDFIVSVYWKWLLSKKVLDIPKKGNVNFHPALLPIGRGWYPHVFSFINGTPTGITIHQMDEGMDTGPIWSQKKVAIRPHDTSKDIYFRLQKEVIRLFKQTWPDIVTGRISPTPQNEKIAISYSMDQVRALDTINLEKTMKVRDVINLLRARSFGDYGFAHYQEKGEDVYVNIRLSPTSHFK